MKTKRLLFISCLAAGALIASPSFGKPAKKSAGMSQSKATRVAPHTTQVMRHNQNVSSRTGGARYYGGARYTGTRTYAAQQYSATRNYGGTRYYGNYYGGNTGYYYGSAYPSYSYYSGSPYSNWGYGTSSGYYPYSYGGGYPHSGYNNYYSYYNDLYAFIYLHFHFICLASAFFSFVLLAASYIRYFFALKRSRSTEDHSGPHSSIAHF